MDLGYALAAVKRYAALVVLGAVLGAVPGLVASRQGSGRAAADAVLQIVPPSVRSGQMPGIDEVDRYVEAQLVVLRSPTIAERTVQDMGQGLSAGDVASAVKVRHAAESNLVTIHVEADDAALARAVADAYANAYLENAKDELTADQAPDVTQLRDHLAAVRAALADVDAKITEAMKPYLPEPGSTAQTPSVEAIAPDLASQRETLIAEYERVLEAQTELETNAKVRLNSQLLQAARPSAVTTASHRTLLLPAGVLGGLMIGIAAAIIAARLSGRAVDDAQIAELLGGPVVAELRRPLDAPHNLAALRQLAARTATRAGAGPGLSVVVASTDQRTSPSETAALLARHVARAGSRVILAVVDARARLDGADAWWARAAADGVAVLDNPFNDRAFRPSHAPAFLEHVAANADVAVLDAGPLIDDAAALRLAHLADVILLVVPGHRQRVAELRDLGQALADRRGQILAVVVKPPPLLGPRSGEPAPEARAPEPAAWPGTVPPDDQPGVLEDLNRPAPAPSDA